MVTFENNESDEFDTIILSTGYNIELKYLSDSIRTKIYSDQKQTKLNVNIAN
jgi:lysine/ornithine N-monooxygenase